ncbi:SsrA-binding protein SmpB [Patescibacteria group bacterium]|nr:SsrA-binding protein SmpB [Patescibacteria group bacterium]
MRIVNRRAKHDYQIIDEIEAGVALTGAEVKSLREGRGSLIGSFVRIKDGEAWLHNFVVPAYRHADARGYDPARSKKLLLHKKEILALSHKMEGKRLALVPLACYMSGRFVKVKLGLGRGKKKYEKREAKRRLDLEREAARALKSRG